MSYYIVPTTAEQMATAIARSTGTRLSPIARRIHCPWCRWQAQMGRRNALAVTARLRGALAKHMREKHQPELTAELTGKKDS